MAEPESLDPSPPPGSVSRDASLSRSRPVETYTTRGPRQRPPSRSRRRPSQTNTSHSTSTWSWVHSTQSNHPSSSGPPPARPIPVPSPVPAVAPLEVIPGRTRPVQNLHTTNPDPSPDEPTDEGEYIHISAADASGNALGFRNEKGPRRQVGKPGPEPRPGGRKFVGGFVKSLRRIPKAVFGDGRRRPSERREANATDATGATLPGYMSHPPTPTLPPEQYERHGLPRPRNIPPSLVPGQRPTSGVPSLQVSPPPGVDDHRHSFPLAEPFDPDTGGSGPELAHSPHPTRIELDETTPGGTIHRSPPSEPDEGADAQPAHLSRHTSQQTPHPNSYSHPASVIAHPQPSPDYRRMSRSIRSVRSTIMSYDPSFSTELDFNTPGSSILRFFAALISMPWVAQDRVTADYFPGRDGGGWGGWKRVPVYVGRDGRVIPNKEGPSAFARGDARKSHKYKPVSKPLTSWYSGVRTTTVPAWAKRAERELDLMSSGSEAATRSSVGTGRARRRVVSSVAPASPTRRSRNRESHRMSQRLYYSVGEYAFVDPGSSPPSSPMRARRPTREERSGARSRRKHERSHHHTRRHAHSRSSPRPPMPTYPHGYVPGPYNQSATAPMMFLPPSALHQFASNGNMNGSIGAGGSEPQSATAYTHPQGGAPIFTPVYMSMLPTFPVSHPGSAGESSPPGLAGRGAGGGYGPGYAVQGYGVFGGGYGYPQPPTTPTLQKPPAAQAQAPG